MFQSSIRLALATLLLASPLALTACMGGGGGSSGSDVLAAPPPSGGSGSAGGSTGSTGGGSGGSSNPAGGSGAGSGGGGTSGSGGTSGGGGSSGGGAGGGAGGGGGSSGGSGSSGDGSGSGGGSSGGPGSGGSSGGSGSGGGSAPFSVPNPYALPGATTVDEVRVTRATIFGDSYSVRNSWPFQVWDERLEAEGVFNEVDNRSIGGTAAASRRKPFKALVDAWMQDDGAFGPGELALVYLGHNDIGDGSHPARLAQSKDAFRTEVDRLVAAGATAPNRRLFLLLIHDWGKSPGHPRPNIAHQLTLDWNNFLISYANSHDRAVAVDLYTVFERVFADPAFFGFTNVTTPDPAHADSTALYYDDIHFGGAGQRLIARVVRHYLTRAWDWANTLQAGAQARAQLQQDIDAGLLNALAALAERGEQPRIFGFAVGSSRSFEQAALASALTQEEGGPDTSRGAGIGLRLSPRTLLAVAFARNDSAFTWEDRDSEENSVADMRAIGFQLRHEAAGGLLLTTHALWSTEELRRASFDVATGSAGRGDTEVLRFELGQSIARPIDLGFGELVPWFDLNLGETRVAGYALSDPYLGSVRFGASRARRLGASFGLSYRARPIALGDDAELGFSVGGGYIRDLWAEPWTVTIQEGLVEREERIPAVERRDLFVNFDAQLRLGDAAELDLRYGLLQASGAEANHVLFATWRYRF